MRPVHLWMSVLIATGCGSAGDDTTSPRGVEPDQRGALEIITTGTGSRSDHDGYELHVNGASGGPMSPEDTLVIPGFPAGQYWVGPSGTAPGCKVGASNPRGVRVVPPDTARAIFVVKCDGPGNSS